PAPDRPGGVDRDLPRLCPIQSIMPLETDSTLQNMAERLGGGRSRRDVGLALSEWLGNLRDRRLATEEQRRRAARIGLGAGALSMVAAGLGAYFMLRPTPEPDYLNDDLIKVLDFTFLQEEFNKLPLDRRQELLGM